MQKTGEDLYKIRQVIAEKEEQNKRELETLKLERDTMQSVLLSDMNKNGLLSLKLESGDSFFKGTRKGVDITNELLAFKWALDQKAVSINKTIVAQILKESKNIPPGFVLVDSEFIGIRKAKDKTNE